VSKLYGCGALYLRDVQNGELPALQEAQVVCVILPGPPNTQEGAAAIEVLRACLTASPVSYSIRGISLVIDEEWEGEGQGEVHLQSWLQPLAALFADCPHQAACVEYVSLAYITVDAGSIQGLASVLSAVEGEAQASSTAIALTAVHAQLPLQPWPHPAFVCGTLHTRLATLPPLVAELDILDCDVAPSTLPECVVSLPQLRELQWSESYLTDISSFRPITLATCRAAFAHPARVADLVFKVKLHLDLEWDEFYEERVDELNTKVQGVRDEWQAERARLQAAGVAGSREFRLEIEVHFGY